MSIHELKMTSEFRSIEYPCDRAIYLLRHADISLLAPANELGVPETTLRHALRSREAGQELHISGRRQILAVLQREQFIAWIISRSAENTPIRVRDVASHIEESIMSRSDESTSLNGRSVPLKSVRRWIKQCAFTVSCGRIIDRGRHDVSDLLVREFFDSLITLARQFVIPPERMWNMDETMVLSNSSDFVGKFVGSGESPPEVSGPALPPIRVTLCACVCAFGQTASRFWIFPRKRIPEEWGAIILRSGGVVTGNQSGWQTKETLEMWCRQIFIPQATSGPESTNHYILILDAATMHASPSVLGALKHANVHVVCLPARSSHLYQPLDRYPFARFKKTIREGPITQTVKEWLIEIVSASQSAFTIKNIRKSFELCRVWPIDPVIMSIEAQEGCQRPKKRGRETTDIGGTVLTARVETIENSARNGST